MLERVQRRATKMIQNFVKNEAINSFSYLQDISGKNPATLQLMREDYSYTHIHLSIASYLSLQLSELE